FRRLSGMSNSSACCRVLLFCALAAPVAWSQVSSGSLLGDVRDEKGASVENALIQIASTTTSVTRTASTNAYGSYRIDHLLPGAYTVTARHEGFQTETVSPLFVEVNKKSRLDFDLHLGSSHESVTVAAHASPLQSDDASEGYTLGSNFLESLPLLGRNIIT